MRAQQADPREVRATTGVCPVCVREVPARVVVDAACARLVKDCPDHGKRSQVLSRHPEEWADLDRFFFAANRAPAPQRDYIVRLTERCNLACPVCLADANSEPTPDLPLAALTSLVRHRHGLKVDLMAAEPTLRDDLESWVRQVKASGNIASLHTNGLRLADLDYVRRLAAAGVDEVYLQFDGFDGEADRRLRGRPVAAARRAALRNLRELRIPTSLVALVAWDVNEDQPAHVLRFALQPENDHVREVLFLGLRLLGRARAAAEVPGAAIGDQAMMPDDVIDLLCAQVPRVRRHDVRAFNKVFFALLSALGVRKCLYIHHYLVVRTADGGFLPAAALLDLPRMAAAAERYAARLPAHPGLARAALFGELALAVRPAALARGLDLARLPVLLREGVELARVPRRTLLLGFITACDPDNFDAQVAAHCGKGELSADGGQVESAALANIAREARFAASRREDPRRRRRAGRPERRSRRGAGQEPPSGSVVGSR